MQYVVILHSERKKSSNVCYETLSFINAGQHEVCEKTMTITNNKEGIDMRHSIKKQLPYMVSKHLSSLNAGMGVGIFVIGLWLLSPRDVIGTGRHVFHSDEGEHCAGAQDP